MITAIIIDDETHCRKALHLLLKEYCPEVHVVEQCGDGESGITAITKLSPDVVFLDIEMPKMNGFEMLQHFEDIPFCVVFITSYNQYAIKAFRYYAIDYLLKPIDTRDLIVAVHRVNVRKQLPSADQLQALLRRLSNKEEMFPKIPVPTSDGFEFIPVEEVLICEARDNYTYFHLKGKKSIIACRMLREVEQQLAAFAFFVRIHNSYIINIREVVKYVRGEGGYVLMSDGTTVNVSRTRKEALLKWFRP